MNWNRFARVARKFVHAACRSLLLAAVGKNIAHCADMIFLRGALLVHYLNTQHPNPNVLAYVACLLVIDLIDAGHGIHQVLKDLRRALKNLWRLSKILWRQRNKIAKNG